MSCLWILCKLQLSCLWAAVRLQCSRNLRFREQVPAHRNCCRYLLFRGHRICSRKQKYQQRFLVSWSKRFRLSRNHSRNQFREHRLRSWIFRFWEHYQGPENSDFPEWFKAAPTPLLLMLLLAFLLVFLNSEGGWAGDGSRIVGVSELLFAKFPLLEFPSQWLLLFTLIFFHKVVAFLYINLPIKLPPWPFKP
jgi:hypothetical protein